MSFSYDAKTEVATSELPTEKHCALAELGGLVRTCGKIEDDYSLSLVTELDTLFSRVCELIKMLYNTENSLNLQRKVKQNNVVRFHIIFPKDLSVQVLKDTYVLRENYAGELEISNSISRHLIENDCCQRQFIKGVFMGCASANIVIKDINDLKKHTGGYHLEFVFSNHTLAGDFAHILSQYDIYSKIMQRKKLTVVYIKEAEIVSDCLALVGANNAVLALQNEFAVREVRNQLNRQLNCMNSNLEKMVDASLKQINAIEYIRDTIGLESLNDNLYELCMLRLANPDETLENLAKLMNPPLTKSGVNHRLRKIVKMANDLKKNNEEE